MGLTGWFFCFVVWVGCGVGAVVVGAALAKGNVLKVNCIAFFVLGGEGFLEGDV